MLGGDIIHEKGKGKLRKDLIFWGVPLKESQVQAFCLIILVSL